MWCYTVDVVTEGETDENIIQIVRWRALNNDINEKIKEWHRKRTYNIRSVEQWDAAKNVINDDVSNFQIKRDSKFKIENKTNEFQTLKQNFDDANEKRKKERKNRLKFEKAIREMKTQKRDNRNKIQRLQELVNNPQSTETDVHNLIKEEKMHWLFGLQYCDIESKVDFPRGSKKYQFDLMLEKDDGSLDLVDLKGPNENLFDSQKSTVK
jgi:t-SNARE complex subunit (syntaxin)